MNFYTTLLEQYNLMESLDSVIKSNSHIPEQTIRHYHSTALPNDNKNDRLLNHVLKMHNAGTITPETAHLLKPHLTALSLTNQLNKLKDLNTLNDHINATSEMQTKTITKKERIDINTPTVFTSKDGNIVVKQHLNQESAIRGALMHPDNPMYNVPKEKGKCAWCVSADNDDGVFHYNDYTENGKYPLYTVHNNKTKRQYAVVTAPIEPGKASELRDEDNKVIKPYNLLINNPGLEHSQVGDFIKEYYPKAIKTLKALPHNATPTQIHNAILSGDEDLQKAAVAHPNVTANNLLTALDSQHRDIPIMVMNHKLVDETHISKALGKNHRQFVRNLAINHPKVNEGHIDSVIGDSDDLIYGNAVAHPNASLDHIKNALGHENDYIRAKAISNVKATPSQISKVLDDKTSLYARNAAINNANADEDNISKALRDSEPEVKLAAIKHKNLTAKNITQALKDKTYEFVRAHALNSNKVTKSHIKQALKDESPNIRAKALRHHLTTHEQLVNAMDDFSPEVKHQAARVLRDRAK